MLEANKIQIQIPFAKPIGSKRTAKIKPAAEKPDVVGFAEEFGKFFGEEFSKVEIQTESLFKEDESGN